MLETDKNDPGANFNIPPGSTILEISTLTTLLNLRKLVKYQTKTGEIKEIEVVIRTNL